MAAEAKIAGLFLLRKLKKDLQGLLDGVPLKKIRSDVIPEFVKVLDVEAKKSAEQLSATGALASGVFVQRGGGYSSGGSGRGLEAVSISVRGSAGAYARILNTGGTIRAKSKYLTVPIGQNLSSKGTKVRSMRDFPETAEHRTFISPAFQPKAIAGPVSYKSGIQVTTYALKKVMYRQPGGTKVLTTRKSRKTGGQVPSKPRIRKLQKITPVFLLARRVVYTQTGVGWATQAKNNAVEKLRYWLEGYLRNNRFVGKG